MHFNESNECDVILDELGNNNNNKKMSANTGNAFNEQHQRENKAATHYVIISFNFPMQKRCIVLANTIINNT